MIMTRLTAHQRRYKIENMTTNDTIYDLIEKIYDDLDKEICENCSFFHEHEELNAFYCELEVSCNSSLGQDIVEEDFGCKKFEPKL